MVTETTIREADPAGPDGQAVIRIHREHYESEFGIGESIERVVRPGIADFAARPGSGRLWVVDDGGEVRGCIGVTLNGGGEAQLRWCVLDPALRGRGLGRELVAMAVGYAREQGCRSMSLVTIPQLTTAAHLYREAGFELKREDPQAPWGGPGVEQRYELTL